MGFARPKACALTVTSQRELAVHLVAEVKREHRPRHRILVDGVLENGRRAPERQSLEAQSQYAVEFSHDVSHAQSPGVVDLRELLILNDNVLRERDVIDGEITVHVSRSVLDVKVGSVLLEGRRLGLVVLGLAAVDEPVAAILAIDLRHPKVRRAGVEYDCEFLGWTADLDRAVILGVGVVLDDDVLGLGLDDGDGGGGRDLLR